MQTRVKTTNVRWHSFCANLCQHLIVFHAKIPSCLPYGVIFHEGFNQMSETSDSKILIEWSHIEDRQRVGRLDDLIGSGEEALEKAGQAIIEIGEILVPKITTLATDPTQRQLKTVEVEFGLKIDAEAGIIVSKTGIEAAISVKFIWEK